MTVSDEERAKNKAAMLRFLAARLGCAPEDLEERYVTEETVARWEAHPISKLIRRDVKFSTR